MKSDFVAPLTLTPTNKTKEKLKIYEELWCKIRDLIRSKTKNSYDYDKKSMKNKFDLDYNLPLNKTVEIPIMTIVVRAAFDENNKYCLRVFLRWMSV